MNYQLHYDRLITKHGTWEKPEGIYTERHRKLPGCFDGQYVKGNAFYMIARAHYVAHLLLAKIYPKEPAVWKSINAMSGKHGRKVPSWWYKRAREACLGDWQKRGKAFGEKAIQNGYLKKAVKAASISLIQKEAARLNQQKCAVAVKGTTPMISLNNKTCYVKLEHVQEKLNEGWKIGSVEVRNTSAANAVCRGAKVITFVDGTRKFVRPSELDQWLAKGWRHGWAKL